MEDLAMLNSEMVVGLWFVPVVLFIVIPLLMLCLFSAHKFFRAVIDRIEQTNRSTHDVQSKSVVSGIRARHAI